MVQTLGRREEDSDVPRPALCTRFLANLVAHRQKGGFPMIGITCGTFLGNKRDNGENKTRDAQGMSDDCDKSWQCLAFTVNLRLASCQFHGREMVIPQKIRPFCPARSLGTCQLACQLAFSTDRYHLDAFVRPRGHTSPAFRISWSNHWIWRTSNAGSNSWKPVTKGAVMIEIIIRNGFWETKGDNGENKTREAQGMSDNYDNSRQLFSTLKTLKTASRTRTLGARMG